MVVESCAGVGVYCISYSIFLVILDFLVKIG
jgi:hypothetical protein